MNGREKSDLPIVAGKPANGAVQAAEESVERRGGAKENADPQNTVRTQSREVVSRMQARIRGAVSRNKTEPLTALLYHVSLDVLRVGFFSLKKTAAPGTFYSLISRFDNSLTSPNGADGILPRESELQ